MMSRVTIPIDLIPPSLATEEMEIFIAECTNLRRQLIEELSSPGLAHRTHGSHKTYLDGCAGPLCTQAHRLYYRKARNSEPTDYWRVYDPILTSLGKQVKIEMDSAVERARTATLLSLGQSVLYKEDG